MGCKRLEQAVKSERDARVHADHACTDTCPAPEQGGRDQSGLVDARQQGNHDSKLLGVIGPIGQNSWSKCRDCGDSAAVECIPSWSVEFCVWHRDGNGYDDDVKQDQQSD
eukprot:2971413-Amphidinium_carterae.1